jgi:hypothetical protein
MPIVTIIYGLLLTVLGLISYFGTGMLSMTALIPAFFGLPILICGVLARDEAKLRHAMHGAATLSLLGFLGAAPGLLKMPALLSGEFIARPEAVKAQAIMAILSLIFVILCVRSFINIRRARK